MASIHYTSKLSLRTLKFDFKSPADGDKMLLAGTGEICFLHAGMK